MEALKGAKTIQEIAKQFDVHPMQVSDWKKTMVERAAGVFGPSAAKASSADFEKEREKLHSKIGQLTVEMDFLRKKSKQLGL